jgi:hypothetical protein
MAITVQISGVDASGDVLVVTFNLVASGNYATNGGDVCNFATAIADPTYIGPLPAVVSSQLLQFDVWTQGGNLTRDYVANKVGTSPASGAKFKINQAKGSTSEQNAGAYPSDVTADSITGMAVFTKLI